MATETYISFREQEPKIYPVYANEGKLEKILGENQVYTFKKKYLDRNKKGEIVESPDQAAYRVSRTMAEVEFNYGKTSEEVDKLTYDFFEMIVNGWFSPGG